MKTLSRAPFVQNTLSSYESYKDLWVFPSTLKADYAFLYALPGEGGEQSVPLIFHQCYCNLLPHLPLYHLDCLISTYLEAP